LNEDHIATAVQDHAPDRAVTIWKGMAERLIDQVKPSAYRDAAKYLRKAGQIMNRQKKKGPWDRYMKDLKERHSRKRRLMQILNNQDDEPILRGRR
jgi:uncharacterized Zn finger protein